MAMISSGSNNNNSNTAMAMATPPPPCNDNKNHLIQFSTAANAYLALGMESTLFMAYLSTIVLISRLIYMFKL